MGSSTKTEPKGENMAGEEKKMQDRQRKEKGKILYIPMHQPGFQEHVSSLVQKATTSTRAQLPQTSPGQLTRFLRFPEVSALQLLCSLPGLQLSH